MEPPGGLPSDKDGQSVVHQQPNSNSLKQQGPQSQLQRHLHHHHHHQNHHHHNHQSSQLQQQQPQLQSQAIPLQQQQLQLQHSGLINITPGSQPTIEKLSRPMAFDKMESLVREMQVPVHGVPVRQQKMFLTSIPYAFMGYDLIEWLMDRLIIEESEALNIANQLCLHGYFFPVNDTKTLTVKDDSSLYRFQTPYYWPWQHKAPDNVEYAIYLAKRSLRNKQRHALEDYESEALASLHKNLKGKWDFIAMQADEQVRLAKERKKGDKIVGDSQERAYWRVHRPPPGQFTPLEPCPVPSRERQGIKAKKKTVEDWQLEVEYLRKSLTRTRMKMSQACESLVSYSETFSDYEFFLQPVLPSNPWVSEDITFWQLNNALVETATEKRVRRWAISIEELVSDPTGLNEFTTFLEKEYSHENIRFWIEVNKLRRSAHSRVASKVNEIYEEFLKPGARCEINIDGKTMELVQRGLKNPSRFTFDAAAEHIYMLLLKKDCYPRFVRSDHYKNLLANSIQPLHKKRFFNFGGVGVKKKMAVIPSTLASQSQMNSSTGSNVVPGHLTRRRGSDRSLSGSVHELAVIGIKDTSNKVPHSHSQSNLSDISYREGPKPMEGKLETTLESATAVCPWDDSDANQNIVTSFHVSICPWEQEDAQANTSKRLASTSSDISDVSDRMTRACGLRQNTVDSSDYNTKRLTLECTEQRRASISLVPRISDFHRSVETASLTVPICVSDVAIPSSTTVVNDSVEASDDNEPRMDTKISETDDSMPPPSEKTTTTEEIEIVADDDVNDEVIELPCLETEVQIELIEIDKFDESLITLNASDEGPYPGTTVKETTPKLVREDSILLPEDPFIDAKPKCSDEHMGEDLEDYRPKKTDSTIPVTCITEPGKRSSPDVIPNSNTNNVSNQEESQSSQENPLLECGAESNAICEETMQVDIEIYPASRTPPTNIPIPHCSDSGKQLKEAKSPGDNEKAETRDEDAMLQEELSPATEEYQEIQLGGRTESYDYDIDDVITPGCVAPAPTPAPLLAPLAEIDLDPVEDELEHPPKKAEGEEGRKKRKKHNVESKKSEDKVDKPSHSKEHLAAALEKKESPDHKTVCPWEDEDVTASDTTFVKTYATLGYL